MPINKITKAVFVVAGSGTRFLPYTKAQPKEMLPIIDKPIIQHLVEEAIEAGIEDIIFVTAKGKESIENHFDKNFELEYLLTKKGKLELLRKVEQISNLASFAYVRQPEPKGDGHALLCAKHLIGKDETILMVFPDYIMPHTNNTFQNMIATYNDTQSVVIGTDLVPMEKTKDFGVLKFTPTEKDKVVSVEGFVEKPKSNPPSNLINNGYAVLPPQFWKYLENASGTVGDGEIRVADAYIKMLEDGQKLYAVQPTVPGYDCGNQLGFLKATVDFALQREDLRAEFLEFLRGVVK